MQSVPVSRPVLTKLMLTRLFEKKIYTEFHENPTKSSVGYVRSQTDKRTDGGGLQIGRYLRYFYS
jgi:hypothetical protein